MLVGTVTEGPPQAATTSAEFDDARRLVWRNGDGIPLVIAQIDWALNDDRAQRLDDNGERRVQEGPTRRVTAWWYSRLRRATRPAAEGMSCTAPMPWPAPQMSRQALAAVLLKSIFEGSLVGR